MTDTVDRTEFSLLGLARGVIPPTLNCEALDDACPVRVVTSPEAAANATFLALNHNASGQAAAMVIADVAREAVSD